MPDEDNDVEEETVEEILDEINDEGPPLYPDEIWDVYESSDS